METHCLDLTDWDSTTTLVKSLGPIDLLINNAATGVLRPILDFTKSDLDRYVQP